MGKLPEIKRIYSWTEDDVRRILVTARDMMDTEAIPHELRPVAFEKAISMLSHHVPIAVESGIAVPGQGMH